MKSVFKWIIIIITSIIFLYVFSPSYISQNIDNLDYVVAIGIDYSEDKSCLQVSFEFADINSFSEDNSSSDSEPIIDRVAANSISSAINIMNAYEGKQLNLSHCKIIVFSEDVAKNGIYSEITELVNNNQIRPTTNIIISDAPSSDYIENSTSSLEQVLTKYYEIFPNSSLYTGYTSNVTLKDFYDGLTSSSTGSVAILGTLNSDLSQESETSSSSDSSSESNDSSTSNTDSDSASESSNNAISNTDTDSNTNTTSNATNETYNSSIADSSYTNLTSGDVISGDRNTENFGLCIFKNGSLIR